MIQTWTPITDPDPKNPCYKEQYNPKKPLVKKIVYVNNPNLGTTKHLDSCICKCRKIRVERVASPTFRLPVPSHIGDVVQLDVKKGTAIDS